MEAIMVSYIIGKILDYGIKKGNDELSPTISEEQYNFFDEIFTELSKKYDEFNNKDFFTNLSKKEITFKNITEIDKTFQSIFGENKGNEIYQELKKIIIEKSYLYPKVKDEILLSCVIENTELLKKMNTHDDSGQILDYEDFIKIYDSSKYSTSLNTNFKFREKEKEIFDSNISNSQIILITGDAGIGKTKFALEVCNIYATKNNYILKTLLNRGGDLFDDIKVNFTNENHQYLIFIDDVNRVHMALKYIKEYHSDKLINGKIKIVMTVRSYAKEKILEMIPSKIKKIDIQLDRMTSKEIKEISKNEFNINNPVFLEKIGEMSQGNPRLAMMISAIAKEKNDLTAINDVSTVYEEYFSSIQNELDIFTDDNLLLTVTIIAFFRIIDKQNEIQIKLIEDVFHISLEEFWKNIEILNKSEIVDLYENNAVKISDQILLTYLFYKIIFIEKKVDINIFLENLFFDYRHKFVDILNPLLNTFDYEHISNVLNGPIESLWEINKDDEINLYKVMETFWFLKETDILIYLNKRINELSIEKIEIASLNFWDIDKNTHDEDNVLNILTLLRQDPQLIDDNIELLINYLKKRPSKLHKVIKILTEDYGYEYNSYMHKYTKEKKLLDKLWELSKNGEDEFLSRLFIRVSSYFLKIQFNSIEGDGNKIVIKRFEIIPTEDLKELRGFIFNNIFSLYSDSKYRQDIFHFFKEYPHGIGTNHNVEIIKEELPVILTLIEKTLDNKSYEDCQIVNDILNFFDRLSIEYEISFRKNFEHENHKLEKILYLDQYDFKYNNSDFKNKTYEELKDIKKEILRKFILNYSLNDWKKLFDDSLEIFEESQNNSYLFQENMNELFNIIAKLNKNLYIKVFKEYLKLGNPFDLRLYLLPLIDFEGKHEAHRILNNYEYKFKNKWLFQFYINLPVEKIEDSDIINLISLYKTTDIQEISFHLDYIDKYLSVEPNLLAQIVSVLVYRSKSESINYITGYKYIFNPHSNIFKNLEVHFKDNLEILKESYLLFIRERGGDHKCGTLNKLLEFDNNFIEEYINIYFNNKKGGYLSTKNIDFNVIWQRSDYEKIFLKVVDTVFKVQNNKNIWFNDKALSNLFPINDELIGDKINNFLKCYIDIYYEDDLKMIFIFKLISNFSSDKRVYFIKHFLNRNNSFDLFSQLSLVPSREGWSGSRVPKLEKKKEYYKSLLSIMSGIQLLEHRKKIEEKIEYTEEDINHHKKRDFMEDF